jgi:hypothetical protein
MFTGLALLWLECIIGLLKEEGIRLF